MKIPVIVESQAEYEAWLATQPTFVASEDPAVEDEATDEANEEVVAENVTAEVITNED
jgi:heme/copper-type cytochrome/quinol oxidase subunit 2